MTTPIDETQTQLGVQTGAADVQTFISTVIE